MDPVIFVVVSIGWRVGPGIHGDIKNKSGRKLDETKAGCES
jgi:hypothetical protein